MTTARPPATSAWPDYFSPREGACSVRVRVIPRAGVTRIAGVRDGALLIRLAAAPVDGEANEELTSFLAKTLGASRRHVTIGAGQRSRDKRIDVAGLDPSVVLQRLSLLLPGDSA